VGPPETREANTHPFAAPQVSPGQLRAVCEAMPFLAERRLVMVEGVLSQFSPRQGRDAPEQSSQPQLGEWQGIEALAKAMPPTTMLVFVDGELPQTNPLLRLLRPLAEVRHFPLLKDTELDRWAKEQVTQRGGQITPGALRLLTRFAGDDQRALEGEIEKLCLYAHGRPIVEEDVRLLASESREANIFAAVDALLEARPAVAARLLFELRDEGASLFYILSMVARQLRLDVLAKEQMEAGLKPEEVGKSLSIRQDFVLRKTLDQARRYPWPRLRMLYQRLLDADLSVKRGRADEGLALDLLIGDLTTPRARTPLQS
ncbi:MAG: DNA polymerase III subunit delta, partial [Chloroflexota bacterium]|nr:DNA polymerase III subunit delta [Chloroflexota bacterium]